MGARTEITAEGLTAVLRSEGHDVTVADLRCEAVGTGQMATSLRLTPTYQGDRGPLPDTFVAKVPAEISGPMVAGAYRTEVDFYRHLAPTLEVQVPHCWHAFLSDDATDFLLLLDDLAPATQGDQLSGCGPGDAIRAVTTLAGLHGPRWCDPRLATDGPLTPVSAQDAATLPMVMEPMTEVFLDRFAGRVQEADAEVLRAVAPVMGTWITGRPRPFAPVHGDYRLDNLMFAPDEGPVTALDWQTVSLGLPARDVAYLCATSLGIEDRRAHEREVVAAWQDGLAALGVGGLTLEGCFEDYRYGLLQAPLVTVLGCAVGTPTERGDAMFLAMIERACAAIRDLDPLSLL